MIGTPTTRIGFVYPAVVAEVILERAYRDLPRDIRLVLSTARIQELRDGDIKATEDRWLGLADELARFDVDGIVLGGAPVSNALGVERELEFVRSAVDSTGRPVTTIALAARRELDQFGARRVGVLTPYPKHRTALTVSYLQDLGYEVVADYSMEKQIRVHHLITPAEVVDALRTIRERAEGRAWDAVYIPCMQFPLPQRALLESMTGVPVVTAMSAFVNWSISVRDGAADLVQEAA